MSIVDVPCIVNVPWIVPISIPPPSDVDVPCIVLGGKCIGIFSLVSLGSILAEDSRCSLHILGRCSLYSKMYPA